MKRNIALLIICAVVWGSLAPVGFAQSNAAIGPPGLSQIEHILYGRTQDGALLERLERAEIDVYGRTQDGSAFLVRLQRLVNVLSGAEDDIGLKMKLNAIEWAMFQQINEGPSINRRLEQLEAAMFGDIQKEAGLVTRLDQLLEMMWPGGKVYVGDVTIPKGTLVRVELLTALHSERSKVNDPVQYRVVDDVKIDNQVVIPIGAEGEGHIISVETAGRLGRDGKVQVDFGSLSAMDSSLIKVQLDARASERNHNVELAAGASIAGAAVLGPLGLAAGLFVMGDANVVPVGSKFYVEVAQETKVNGLSLIPIK